MVSGTQEFTCSLRELICNARLSEQVCLIGALLVEFPEKKDLVELIIRESGGGATSSAPTSPTTDSAPTSTSRRYDAPVERQTSFPKAYVESSHRHDWFEKLDRARDSGDPEAEADTPLAPTAEDADADPVVLDEVVEIQRGWHRIDQFSRLVVCSLPNPECSWWGQQAKRKCQRNSHPADEGSNLPPPKKNPKCSYTFH